MANILVEFIVNKSLKKTNLYYFSSNNRGGQFLLQKVLFGSFEC